VWVSTGWRVICCGCVLSCAAAQDVRRFQPGVAQLTLLSQAAVELTNAVSADPLQRSDPSQPELTLGQRRATGRWSFEFGVGIITDNTPTDYPQFKFDALEGQGEGLTYNFTVARRLIAFDFELAGKRFRPQLELPFMLTLVDDRLEGIIPDINLGLNFRWQDFPWNRYVYTTLALGAGLSYSFDIWTADVQRHEGEERSNLKFWLPASLTFALPQYPRYQLTVFMDHQSGGFGLFDEGGVDAFGFGFRIVF
jgi:hypothetical protein